jgi:hypothetical protein
VFPKDGGVNVEDNRVQTVLVITRGDVDKPAAPQQLNEGLP